MTMIVQRVIVALAHALVVTPDLATPAWRAAATACAVACALTLVGLGARPLARLAGLLGLVALYYYAPLGPAQDDVPGAGGNQRPRGRRRRFPARVAARWAVTWAASLALFVAARTVGRAPFIGLLRWIHAAAPSLQAHPTAAQTLYGLPIYLGLFILTLAVLAVYLGPVLVPVLAAGHIVVAWLRGGAR